MPFMFFHRDPEGISLDFETYYVRKKFGMRQIFVKIFYGVPIEGLLFVQNPLDF